LLAEYSWIGTLEIERSTFLKPLYKLFSLLEFFLVFGRMLHERTKVSYESSSDGHKNSPETMIGNALGSLSKA